MKVEPEALVAIGKIVKPFGIAGHVVIEAMTDTPSRFRRLRSVHIGTVDTSTQEYAIEKASVETRGVRLKLKNIDDRTSAEHLVGSLLFVAGQERIQPPRGRFFVHDVIGMRVVDEMRGDVGIVCDVLKYPAHDVYVVDHAGKTFMIPAVKEIVRRFDTEGKVLAVRLVDGLLEEQEGVEA